MSASGVDPRAQLVILGLVLGGTLFAGMPGLIGGALVAIAWIASRAHAGRAVRMLAAVVPLAIAVTALDALAGHPADGLAAGARLIVVTAVAIGFARRADPRAIAAGLRRMRIPYPLVFVLLTGARFVPVATTDLAELTDAARLRGLTVRGTAWQRLADWTVLLVPLLVLTIRRGLQLGEAMEARGFSDGARSTTRIALRWRRRDSLALAAALVGLIAVAVLDVVLR